MIRGRRIFVVVALCSRAHFSSAKQMFFFCFPSVAAFTLFPFPYFSLFSFFLLWLQGIWLFVYLQLVSIFTIPFRLCFPEPQCE